MAANEHASLRQSVLTASGLSGKTVTDVIIAQWGSTNVIEIVESGGSHFIKVRHGKFDIGGTNQFGDGTQEVRNQGGR